MQDFLTAPILIFWPHSVSIRGVSAHGGVITRFAALIDPTASGAHG